MVENDTRENMYLHHLSKLSEVLGVGFKNVKNMDIKAHGN